MDPMYLIETSDDGSDRRARLMEWMHGNGKVTTKNVDE